MSSESGSVDESGEFIEHTALTTAPLGPNQQQRDLNSSRLAVNEHVRDDGNRHPILSTAPEQDQMTPNQGTSQTNNGDAAQLPSPRFSLRLNANPISLQLRRQMSLRLNPARRDRQYSAEELQALRPESRRRAPRHQRRHESNPSIELDEQMRASIEAEVQPLDSLAATRQQTREDQQDQEDSDRMLEEQLHHVYASSTARLLTIVVIRPADPEILEEVSVARQPTPLEPQEGPIFLDSPEDPTWSLAAQGHENRDRRGNMVRARNLTTCRRRERTDNLERRRFPDDAAWRRHHQEVLDVSRGVASRWRSEWTPDSEVSTDEEVAQLRDNLRRWRNMNRRRRERSRDSDVTEQEFARIWDIVLRRH